MDSTTNKHLENLGGLRRHLTPHYLHLHPQVDLTRLEASSQAARRRQSGVNRIQPRGHARLPTVADFLLARDFREAKEWLPRRASSPRRSRGPPPRSRAPRAPARASKVVVASPRVPRGACQPRHRASPAVALGRCSGRPGSLRSEARGRPCLRQGVRQRRRLRPRRGTYAARVS